MKVGVLLAGFLSIAALTPRDQLLLLADDALGFYRRELYCEIHDCETWAAPFHLSARRLWRTVPPERRLAELRQQWDAEDAPAWMLRLVQLTR